MNRRLVLSVVLSCSGCLVPRSTTSEGASEGRVGDARHNLLANGTFEGQKSVPWTSSFTEPGKGDAEVSDGAYCIRIEDAGKNRWDAQLRHRDMVIRRGHEYTVSFRAWASAPTSARPKVGMAGPPYAEYWGDVVKLDTTPQTFQGHFTMSAGDDSGAELAFHLGGELAASAPLRICIDDVTLADPEFERKEAEEPAQLPRVLVNQVGYLPRRAKVATLTSDAPQPLPFQLVDGDGRTMAEGTTTVVGLDSASGKRVHTIDFSSFTQPGDAYVLVVEKDVSHPFRVRDDVYRSLKYDALSYFYHNRSGIDIVMPHAREPQWERPAGHLTDRSVPCLPNSGCRYTLDVSGGWYDAGDHGKYVVNGGISAWTLLNQYERLAHLGKSSAQFGDGTLNVPEQKNRIPDLLDEARWELAFLLKMQVPEGQPLAGMVHHKMHDVEWTPMPLAPHRDEVKRYLYPPSTAATLNLAAVAAQAARVFKELDPPFAKTCLAAAERAYRAALAHPKLFARPGGVGGGPYDDAQVADEFYWAATELLITTQDLASYRSTVVHSPYFRRVTTESAGSEGCATAMTWQNTESLGNLSLAIVPSALGEAEQNAAREAVKKSAEAYLKVSATQGFRQPFAPTRDGKYPWGSNASVLNNMLVLALAYDVTGDVRYVDGVVSGMNYLLGNNPLDQSYITGYGARPLQNPHHRFWAHQLDRAFPPPPPGAVSGGPNSGLEDPYARGAGLLGCAPATCFIDHIESYATNEITINWNAPLAWVSAFLDEMGQRGI